MIILFTLLKLGKINSSTEVPIWISTLIDWRYSSESFFLVLFIGAVFCILVSLLINTQPIPSREKNRIGKFYNLLANFISNLILFWAGLFAAWSIFSPFIEFVNPIDRQEFFAIALIISAIIVNYTIIRLKHIVIKG